MKNKISAVYPGSFDPLTNGHLDIIKRASLMFSDITIAVTKNLNKNHLFSLDERMDMISEASKNIKNVKVITFEGLLADYLKKINSFVLIRGLRAVSDFEYEFQMALMNRKINKKIETVFLMPDIDYTFLSSSMIREIAMLGGNTEIFVPPFVEKKLRELKKSIMANK
ncbi:MAG: pantetheine-phosphate adenylyltransferase [Elusimicrobiota bacterium]|jgi:pantetheine-phosphate adenylyltransferase|nr:pantetheine-phosphate adenylyltransferase [Elusimicrobiota bacterium]